MSGFTAKSRWGGRMLPAISLLAVLRSTVFGAETSVVCRRIADRTYEVQGEFSVEASSQDVWNVLTDYNHLSGFIPGLFSSSVRKRWLNGVLLSQKAEGKFYFFSRPVQVLLHIAETPLIRIDFNDVLRKDFRIYKGAWTIRNKKYSPQSEVHYELEASPDRGIPAPIAGLVLKRNAASLLESVRTEILRRKEEKSNDSR
ncbi:MAG: SRPBCC family protein [Elusimicrobiota bacterium]